MLTSPRALDRRHARYMETGNPHAACPPRRRYCNAKSQWRCVFCFLMARIHSDSVGYSRGPFVRVVRVMAIQNRPGVYLVEVVPQPLRFGPGSPEDTCWISFVSPLAGVPHCLLLVQMPVKRPPWILPNWGTASCCQWLDLVQHKWAGLVILLHPCGIFGLKVWKAKRVLLGSERFGCRPAIVKGAWDLSGPTLCRAVQRCCNEVDGLQLFM